MKLLLASLLMPLMALAQADRVSDLLASSHNFAPGGPGPVRSSDNRPCVFCHVAHGGYSVTGYLWNHRTSTAAYLPYESARLDAKDANPAAGVSKLCLSCHDGTVALGETVAARTISISGVMSRGAVLGRDLGRHHPLGIRPVDDGQIFPGLALTPAKSRDPAVQLPGDRIECTSCHDPHSENKDPARGKFLVRSNQGGALCLACHEPSRPAPNALNGWQGSAHQSASHARGEYYGNVAANACLSCHAPHNSIASIPLLRDREENVCAACHGGSGTTPVLVSVMSAFSLAYSHPVISQSGLHAFGENAFPLNANRHAECSDCHNPHAAKAAVFSPVAPGVTPALAGATGVDGLSGQTALRPAANEYEICFKCHANSAGKPQADFTYSRYGRTPWRVTNSTAADPFNARLEFNSAVSRHPVTFPRQRDRSQVPSLRPFIQNLNGSTGRTVAAGTYIYCGDCHNNDQARNSGGAQASGVHGSSWPHILERRNEMEPPAAVRGGFTPGVTYQPGPLGTYALCEKCHDVQGSILLDASFKQHRRHVINANTACATCHDPHGINGGTPTNNFALVNFDTAMVATSSSGVLRYERLGESRGRCYLACHGKDHNPLAY
jgi:predicted CXXCH cytochrome family protein